MEQINRNTPVDAHHDDNSLYPRGEIADRDTGIPPLQENPQADSVLMEPEMIPATKVSLDNLVLVMMTERSIRAASDSCDEADVIPPSNCASISFEWKDSVPGLEIERKEDEGFGFLLHVELDQDSRTLHN